MDPSQRPSPDTPTARAVSLRCLRYARPYLPMIVGAVLLGVVFALGRFGRAYLLKPLLDEALPLGDLDRFYELAWLGAALVVSMPRRQRRMPTDPWYSGVREVSSIFSSRLFCRSSAASSVLT